MSRSYLFRITSEGVDKLQQELEKLGPAGAQAFKLISDASTGLAKTVTPAVTQVDALRAKLEQVDTIATKAGGTMTRYSGVIQQAGYQVGDFAVEIASGQDPLRAFIQQGTQLISMFGPWGAVVGAAAASIGALGVSLFHFGDSAKAAQAAQEAFNTTLGQAAELQRRLRQETEQTTAAMEAQARNMVAKAEAALFDAEQKLAAIPETIHTPAAGRIGAIDVHNDAYDAAKKEVSGLRTELLELQATFGAFDDGKSGLFLNGDPFHPMAESAGKAETATRTLTAATGGLTDTLAGLLDQIGIHSAFEDMARQEAALELQFEQGTISAQAYADALAKLDDSQANAGKAGAAAQKDFTAATDKESAARQKIADREAELTLEPYKNAIQGIQSAWTDGWESVLSGNVDSFSDFFDQVKQLGIKWAAQMASLLTFRPAAGSILGALGQDQLAASLGLQNVGGTSAGQNATAAGSGVGGGFNLGSLANLFSTQGASGGLGSLLFGSAGTRNNAFASGMSPGSAGLFGAGGGGMADFFNSGVGTGIVGAGLSAGISAASGGSSLQNLFAGGGSLIGGIAGSYFGPIGSMAGSAIGGVLGNLLGGLFGGGEKKPPKLKSITGIQALSSGQFGVGNTFTSHIGDHTSALGQSAVGGINEYLASIGGGVSGPLSGTNQLLYYGRTPRYMSIVGGQNNQYGDDAQGAQDAVADFIARTIVAAAKQSKLTGVSDAVATAIKNSGATDTDALQAAVDFGKFYDQIDQIRTPAQSATAALADLAAQMQKSSDQAVQYGLDASKIPEIYKSNFDAATQDAILQLTDPNAYALKQNDIAKAAAIAQAQQLGADVNAVEQEYALKRQAIVEQGLQGVNNTFQDFFNSLTVGPLSALAPKDQYDQARQQYEAAKGSGDASAITAAAQTFLQVSQSFNASTKAYADDFHEVLADIKALGGLTTPIPGFAAGGDFGGGLRLVGENGPEIEATGPARYFDAQTTASIMAAANADLSPKTLANIVRSFGQGDDTELVHMRPDELQAMIAYFGVNAANPVDGLPAFYAGGAMAAGNTAVHNAMDRSYNHGNNQIGGGGGKNGSSSNGQGNSVYNDHGQLIGGASNSSFGKQVTKTGASAAAANSPGAQNAAKGKSGSDAARDAAYADAEASASAPLYGNPTTADEAMAKKYNVTPEQYDKAVRAYAGRIDDFNDRGNSFGDNFGNFLASMVGVNEIDPTFDPTNLSPNADWGFDPASLIGTALGGALGIPGLGFAADKISKFFGRPMEMNLGPSVFGAPDAPNAAAMGINDGRIANDNSASFSGISGIDSATGTGATPAGVLAAGSETRSLSSAITGGSQNSIAGSISAGIARTSKGNDAIVVQLQALQKIGLATNDKLDRLLTAQSGTNDVLKQQVRGSRKVG